MQKKRSVSSLFRGKKPKALWGNASKQERKAYKQLLSRYHGKQKRTSKVLSLEDAFRQITEIEKDRNRDRKHYRLWQFYFSHFCNPETKKFFQTYFEGTNPPHFTQNLHASEKWLDVTLKKISAYLGPTPSADSKRYKKFAAALDRAIEDVSLSSDQKIAGMAANLVAFSDFPNESELVKHKMLGAKHGVSTQFLMVKRFLPILVTPSAEFN